MSTNGSGPALEIQKVVKHFGLTKALDGVSFEVPRNSTFGLLGPNGAGKTTLFSLIAGFLKPKSGAIRCLGVDVEQVSELRGKLSILPQDALFQSNVPILEQLVFFAQLTGYERADAEKEAMRGLEIVGLADVAKKNARTLSHGMAKRLGIAQAFLGKPEVILLDEPTAGLDPVNARNIRDLIQKFPRTGTVVVSSHDLNEIQEMCSHVAILDKGHLVECKTVKEITQASRKVRMTFAKELSKDNIQTIQKIDGVKSVSSDEAGVYMIEIDPSSRKQEEVSAEVVGKLAASGVIPKTVSEGETLESRFLAVTGNKA
jgi:ABC-2 type transport system ATP-binding protein